MEAIIKHKQILIIFSLLLAAAILAIWMVLARQNLGKIPSRGVFVANYPSIGYLIA